MALEFALRPRIKLSEGFAPPRRARFRLPRLALPIAAYWLTAGGITYALIHAHDQPTAQSPVAATPPSDESWWPSQPPKVRESAPEPAVVAPEPAHESTPVAREPVVDAPPAVDTADLSETEVTPNEASARDAEPQRESLGLALPAEKRRKKSVEELTEVAANEPQPQRDVSAPFDPVPLPTLAPLPPPESTPLLGAPPPDAPVAVASALPSCEAAAATANQEIDLAQRDQTPDLSREAIASVLDNGVWIARCDIPMSTSVDLCVAIHAGKVIGVSVSSRPASAAINACVRRRAAGLRFPHSSRVDLAHTHF